MNDIETTRQFNYWMERIGLTEREMNEIVFNRIYTNYAHGTDGHNIRLLVAKLADYLSGLEEQGVLPKFDS